MHETAFEQSELLVYHFVEWVKLGVELAGVVIIAWGVLYSLYRYGKQLFGLATNDFIPLRLSLARFLVVALEFQLAADILGTAIAPDWNAIGKLAAIAIIRTVLNYFLGKEMEKEAEVQQESMRMGSEGTGIPSGPISSGTNPATGYSSSRKD